MQISAVVSRNSNTKLQVGYRYLVRLKSTGELLEIVVDTISPGGHVRYRNMVTGGIGWLAADEIANGLEILEEFGPAVTKRTRGLKNIVSE